MVYSVTARLTQAVPLCAYFVACSACAEFANESWIARYNGPATGKDRAFALALDQAGHAYVGGFSENPSSNFNYTLVKYTPTGQTAWTTHYDGDAQGPDWIRDIAIDTHQNIFITGFSQGKGTGFDFTTLKYSPDGQQLWVARYDGPSHQDDLAKVLVVDQHGNIYIAGDSPGADGATQGAVIKYGPDGEQLWSSRTGPKLGPVSLSDIAVDRQGEVYVAGTQNPQGKNSNFLVIKYNEYGEQLWTRTRDWGRKDFARFLVLDKTDHLVTAGTSMRTFDAGAKHRHEDIAVVKYSPEGHENWSVSIDSGFGNNEIPAGLDVDSEGNVYVAGTMYGTTMDPSRVNTADFIVYKFDSRGLKLWSSGYDGPGGTKDTVSAATLDQSGAYYLFGAHNNFEEGSLQLVTVKFSADGSGQWVATHDGVDSGLPRSIAVDNAKNVWVTGSDELGLNFLTIKYNQIEVP